MAQRRMFSLKVVDTDEFLEMGQGSQLLYFHLSMRADDDGFVSSPKKIQKIIGSADDDLKVLVAKQFILPFQNGVIVIRHWKENNYVRPDRYNETIYKEQKALLSENSVGVYQMDTSGIPNVNQVRPQVRLGKVRLGKDSIINNKDNIIVSVQKKTDEFNQKIREHYHGQVIKESLMKTLLEFSAYWTEPNKAGRLRWELEKTWDLGRRLSRWINNPINNKPNKNKFVNVPEV